MNLFASVENSLINQGGAHLVDQLFGAGTFEGTRESIKTLVRAQVAAVPSTTEAEIISYLETEAEALAPELNAKIEEMLAKEAFSKNAFLAAFEAQALKLLVPAETAAIKALVPDAVHEAFALIPAPVLSVAETVLQDAATPFGGLQSGTGGLQSGTIGGQIVPLATSGEAATNNPTDNPA